MGDLRNRVTRHRRRGEGGFTLIELLVVIAILSVLAAIVIINVTGVKGNAQNTACLSDTQTVQTAADGYYNQNEVYPAVPADEASPAAGTAVNIAELTSGTQPYLQDTPPAGESFAYTGPNGSVQGSLTTNGSTTLCAPAATPTP
jgi:prepilin-type N-terminal cleavage/methylation domain-containing protein